MSDIDIAYRDRQRRMRAEEDAKRKQAQYRADGPAMRALRVVTYVVIIITCLAVLFTMAEVYLALNDMSKSIENAGWSVDQGVIEGWQSTDG